MKSKIKISFIYTMSMPTVAQFNAAVKEAANISKWRSLSVDEIYKIVDYKILETALGESMKLTVEDANGDKTTVWAPERLKETFKIKEDGHYTHIRSNGLKESRSGSKYWSFDVVEIEPESVMHS